MDVRTDKLIDALKKTEDKASFYLKISEEFHSTYEALLNKGYAITKANGLIGVQSISNDLEDFQYFRDLHFMYWGIRQGDWIYDTSETEYYNKLGEIVTKAYREKPL